MSDTTTEQAPDTVMVTDDLDEWPSGLRALRGADGRWTSLIDSAIARGFDENGIGYPKVTKGISEADMKPARNGLSSAINDRGYGSQTRVRKEEDGSLSLLWRLVPKTTRTPKAKDAAEPAAKPAKG